MRLAFLFLTVFAAACGGGGDAPAPSPAPPASPPAPPPPSSNSAPVISGSPATVVTEGQPYEFTPIASDDDGDALVFEILRKPAWASFDATNGRLSGTPTENDVGIAAGVTISVFDGSESASLPPFDIEVARAPRGAATVAWTAPTKNADGSMLVDLAGFRVHYGTVSQNYSDVVVVSDPAATSITVDELRAGTWYFSVTAFDESGNQSAFSDEVSKEVVP